MTGVVLSVVGILLGPLPGTVDARELFVEGNRLYQEGDYRAAVERYETILNNGYDSGELYYNIANSYFKLGDLGRSTLYYERALRLIPRDEDVQANLELTRSLAVDEITPLPGFWPFHVADWVIHLLPRAWVVNMTAASYLLAAVAAVVWILGTNRGLRRWVLRIGVAAAGVTLILGVELAALAWSDGRSPHGIILVSEVAVHSAPSDERGLQVFTIHEGTKVRIDQEAGEWVEIVLADGKVGWIKEEAFEII